MIREMLPDDSSRVLEIYRMGLETRNSAFETEVPTWEVWDSMHLPHSRLVFEESGMVLGWIALSPFSTREVYKGVAELSVYVDINYQWRNIGSCLMEQVIASSELYGIWTIVSSVFPENEATIRLHQKFGFRIVGKRERIAMLDGKWRDTVLLERRSAI